MSNGGWKTHSIAALVLTLPIVLAGCGSEKKTSFSGAGGSSTAQKEIKYKGQDADLVARSNKIGVYTAPDNARTAMHRAPDEVVDNGNGSVTHYYNADNTPTSERLQLKYSGGRLVSKEIVPPDANAPGAKAVSRYEIPESNAANYVDLREYNPKAGTSTKTQASRYGANNPADNANADFNSQFNQKLNVR